ncbi:hypothetical protein DFH28DRAFT_532122 [Melampsora americana]|nr:hypothetical protein DFH28DRAFT_532122 [Melampsora americana]
MTMTMSINEENLPKQNPINGHSIPTRTDDLNLSMEIKIDELDDFVWEEDYQEILNSFTSNGLPNSIQSPINSRLILKIILSNLKLIIENYLKLKEEDQTKSQFEIRHSQDKLNSTDLQIMIKEISNKLMDFNQPFIIDESIETNLNQLSIEEFDQFKLIPFTIQRLSELVSVPQLRSIPNDPKLGIHPHYLTLPKYLRAIQKVISVTSSMTSYHFNTFNLPPSSEPEPNPSDLSHSHQSSSSNINGDLKTSIPFNPTIRPTPTRPRRPSTSTPITPVLSPIQWLINSPLITSETSRSRQSSPLVNLSPNDERPITPPLGTHSTLDQLDPSHHSIDLNPFSRLDESNVRNGNGNGNENENGNGNGNEILNQSMVSSQSS